jgi:multicomponent K+:H+ antiporter subunit D
VSRIADHLILAPVALPLLAGAVMLLVDERRRALKAGINVACTFALIGLAIALLLMSDAIAPDGMPSHIGVYRLGSWPAPFGIVLVADRLSTLMLLLTSILAAAAVVFSLARWHRAGAHFHSLFQFLLAGLNGAFLTGDLFNLFVFFELLLAASYGLVLHGSGPARVKAGLHYIAVNLVASLLFLIGVSLIYGIAGTLNMADLAARIPAIPSGDRRLVEAGAAVLGIAFLLKAGIWPMGFWLSTTYSAATPPVAAVFAIMTKVGAYVVLRLWLLLFGEGAGASAQFGGEWLVSGGLMTIAFGAIGMLASQDMSRLAAFAVLVSSGTVFAAIGMGQAGITAGALYYMIGSTLGTAAFFLLVELVERGREPGADMLAVTREVYGEGEDDIEEDDEVGITVPATMAMLGLGFIACASMIAGLPPLSGFIAKFALLSAALNPPGMTAGSGAIPAVSWALLVALVLSGLAALIAMTRAGIRAFWAPVDRAVPHVRVIEMAPVAALLVLCAIQAAYAGPIMQYMRATAQSLHGPWTYMHEVMEPPHAMRRVGGT